MVVDDMRSDDSYLYSNIDDDDLHEWMGLPPNIDHFLNKLNELDIDIPTEMIDEILLDKTNNIGNKEVAHN